MTSNPQEAVAGLRAIGALATKLADDVAGHRLWEHEYAQALAEIQRLMRGLP